MLTQVLNHLKNAYLQANALDKALWVLEVILLVNLGSVPRLKFTGGRDRVLNSLVEGEKEFQQKIGEVTTTTKRSRFSHDVALLSKIRSALN